MTSSSDSTPVAPPAPAPTPSSSLKGFNTILHDNAIFQQQYLNLVGKEHLIRLSTLFTKTLPPEFDGRIVWKDYLIPVI
jgi:hypothetical protein